MNVLSCTTTISQLSWSENNINRNSLQQPWILICISPHILIHVSTRHLHRKKDQDWGWIDLGNEHDNGPHQDQIFDNLAVHCLALRSKNLIQLLEGLMHLTGSSWREYTSLIFLNFRSSRSKYSVSTISCFLVCFFLVREVVSQHQTHDRKLQTTDCNHSDDKNSADGFNQEPGRVLPKYVSKNNNSANGFSQ